MKLRVMADYASSGIWVIDSKFSPWRHGMIEHESLKLPKELAQEFTEWIKWYWQNYEDHKNFDVKGFNKQGLELAQKLKSFLGEDYHVEYEGEPPGKVQRIINKAKE